MSALLEVDGVSKTFVAHADRWRRGGGGISAVGQGSLTIAPGERLGLVGESGSGKSTLARMLVGLLSPDAGVIRFKGDALRAGAAWPRDMRRRVQMIFQDPTGSLNPLMTVEELVSEPFVIHRLVERAQRRSRVEALLRLVQLPAGYRRRLPRELSGGERQRVGIARAMATEPELLICDEPIASLDVSVGAKILELLRQLSQAHHAALLFISHDVRAVAALCERIAVMSEGRLVEVGPTQDLLANPRQRYTDVLIQAADLDLDAASILP